MTTRRRRITAALVAAAVLVLGGAIAALIVAAAASDDPPPAVISTGTTPVGGSGLPMPVRVTLEEAAMAMPFTVLAPDPPPPSGDVWVFRSPDDPRFFPQVTIDYLPERTGHGISLIEGAKRGRSPRDGERTAMRDGRTVYVINGPPESRRVRAVVGGTDVAVSGQDATLDELIGVAASLRPVGP